MKRNLVVELFWKLHPHVYRWTRGRVLGRLVGMDVLLLTTTGAKTGRERTTALTYFVPQAASDRGREAYAVVGSVLGEPRHPGWVHNLRANPEATLQVGALRFRARAREAEGEERAVLWKQLIALNDDYAEYEHRTDRVIPIVVLEALE